jgi:hypothetical protein
MMDLRLRSRPINIACCRDTRNLAIIVNACLSENPYSMPSINVLMNFLETIQDSNDTVGRVQS